MSNRYLAINATTDERGAPVITANGIEAERAEDGTFEITRGHRRVQIMQWLRPNKKLTFVHPSFFGAV